MKKRIMKIVLILILALILFLPIPTAVYSDGGTRVYSALTYKIVVWNRLIAEVGEDGTLMPADKYQKTSVFFFPNSLKSIDELWKIEKGK